MKYSWLIFCCLITALTAETKTSLDDIEKDNLKSEKATKIAKSTGTQTKFPAPSPAQYGFVPIKTAADYAQQQPTAQYLYNPQTFISPRKPQSILQQQQILTEKYRQAIQPQRYVSQQYVAPQTTQTPIQTHQYVTAPQQYVTTQQHYVTAPQQYVIQPQIPQQKYVVPTQAYRQNIQYVTDNSIAQPQQKQYYTPQYVYVQQYPQATNSIQAVIDPKGGLQYIMYVPAIVPAAAVPTAAVNTAPTQGYENVVLVNPTNYATTQAYQQPAPQYTHQYVPQTQTQPGYISKPHSSGISSSPRKQQPKSLLDSYIPSSLQLQYLKQQQQQAQANIVSQQLKQVTAAAQAGKTDHVKSAYKSPQAHSSESVVTYKSPQTHGSESAFTYKSPQAPGSESVFTYKGPQSHGSESALTYRSPQAHGSESVLTYRSPHTHGSEAGLTYKSPQAHGSESVVTYDYQLPYFASYHGQ